ncbi:hypothetical protein ACWERV_35215 [Streptomyces sp. NPDC004031]
MTGAAGKKRERPPFGMPRHIVLLATPQGWRHSLTTTDGALVCGGLNDLPADAGPAEARRAATDMLTGLCREFHGTGIDVTWTPPDRLTGRVVPQPAPPAD